MFGKIKKCVAALMVCCCMIQCAAMLQAFAASYEDNAEEKAETNVFRMKEIEELRDVNSETYLLSDGTYECRVFAEDKYYQNDSGELIAIDNSIVSTKFAFDGTQYGYGNASGKTEIYFSDADVPSVLMILPDSEPISFSPVKSTSVKAVVDDKYMEIEFDGFKFDGDNSIRFEDLFQSTDFIYSVVNSGLKEYIILKDSLAPTEFLFNYTVGKNTVKSNDNGTITFYNPDGKEILTLNSLFAVDSNGCISEKLGYTIADNMDGTVTVGVKLSEEYVNSKERVFPILIDPTVTATGSSTTYDACVCSMYPSTNYQYNSFLRTGRDDEYYIRRSYIKFTLPSSLSGTTINSAYLDVFKCSGATPNVSVYRVNSSWSSSSITWNNKPSFSSSYGTLYNHSGGWYRTNIATLVQHWINGTYTNYGVVLKDSTETGTSQWTTYYSADSSSYLPELIITYTGSTSTPASSVNLSVPYYPQETTITCGAASLRMVLAYYGYVRTEQQVKDLAYEVTGNVNGYKYQTQHYAVLNRALSNVTHSYHSFTSSSLSDAQFTNKVNSNLSNSHPIIVLVNWQSDRTYFPYSTEGHFIVVKGIDTDGKITILDPYSNYAGTSSVTLPASTLKTYAIGRTFGEVTSVSW